MLQNNYKIDQNCLPQSNQFYNFPYSDENMLLEIENLIQLLWVKTPRNSILNLYSACCCIYLVATLCMTPLKQYCHCRRVMMIMKWLIMYMLIQSISVKIIKKFNLSRLNFSKFSCGGIPPDRSFFISFFLGLPHYKLQQPPWIRP